MNVFQRRQLLLVTLAGWISRQQQDVIAYIQEENRILENKLKGKRIRFTDDERGRLAVKGKVLGRKVLREIAWIVTPDTILTRHRKLVAQKWGRRPRPGWSSPPRRTLHAAPPRKPAQHPCRAFECPPALSPASASTKRT